MTLIPSVLVAGAYRRVVCKRVVWHSTTVLNSSLGRGGGIERAMMF